MNRAIPLGAALLLAAGCVHSAVQPAAMLAAAQTGEACLVTPAQQDEARGLLWQEFDQVGDQPGSFRVLADSGCPNAALAAYADWLEHGPGFPDARTRGIGTFHRAQLLAIVGREQEAMDLLPLSFRTPGDDDPRAGVWNSYLHGVIAFFERDRTGVEAARLALEQEPDDAFAARQVGVLQGLLDCFDKNYQTAMSDACRS